jgi:5-methylcytosine-specific restriction protein A
MRQAQQRRPKPSEQGYTGEWRRIRLRFLKANPYCADPHLKHARRHQEIAATVVDHIVPKSQGGTDDEANLRGLCASCHGTRHAKDGDRWG